jgi:hypothetical protein
MPYRFNVACRPTEVAIEITSLLDVVEVYVDDA